MPDTLLTGATGFIGSALLGALVADGRSVRALVRRPEDAGAVAALGAEPLLGDLSDPESLRRATDGCSVVYHAAGLNAMCLADSTRLDRVNIDGTAALVSAAADAGVGRFVYTSSAAAIGEPEGAIGVESTPHRGSYNTAYERSKHRAEMAALELAGERGIDLVAVNPSSVQGPGRTGGTARILIAYLRGRLRFAVDTRMSLVCIDDVVRAHLRAEDVGEAGERYLVSGWTATVREAIAALGAVTGVTTRVRFVPSWSLGVAAAVTGAAYRLMRRDAPLCAEMMRALRHGHAYDGTRIEAEWGFRYTPPETWLTETVEWYRSEGIV